MKLDIFSKTHSEIAHFPNELGWSLGSESSTVNSDVQASYS